MIEYWANSEVARVQAKATADWDPQASVAGPAIVLYDLPLKSRYHHCPGTTDKHPLRAGPAPLPPSLPDGLCKLDLGVPGGGAQGYLVKTQRQASYLLVSHSLK